ncbi:MAG: hypothetical protein WCV68_01030 [Candidatus Paceibacterota bacterium]|jgi:hypothetical protein
MIKNKSLILSLIIIVILGGLIFWGVYSVRNAPHMEVTGLTVKACPNKDDRACWLPEVINCNIGSKVGPFYAEDNNNKPVTLYEKIIDKVTIPDEKGPVCKTIIYSTSHNDWKGSFNYYGQDGEHLPRIRY